MATMTASRPSAAIANWRPAAIAVVFSSAVLPIALSDAPAQNRPPAADKQAVLSQSLVDANGEPSAVRVAELLRGARLQGHAARGLLVFSDARFACQSCHKIGNHGGTVGPDLTRIGKQRQPIEIAMSLFWPNRKVEQEYVTHLIVTDDGRSHRGTLLRETPGALVLRDPTQGPQHEETILIEQIEVRREVGSLMPDNLTAAMTRTELLDLLQLLTQLGREEGLPLAEVDSVLHHGASHRHGPATVPMDRKPLDPAEWPNWQHRVNRDRIYDFYAKQADHCRQLALAGQPVPAVLAPFPGLDGGTQGHWGNQNDETWSSAAWNATDRGRLQCGVVRFGDKTVPRGVCLLLGKQGELACCFNPDTLTYEAAWTGGFVETSSYRHGFLHGLLVDGKPVGLRRSRQPTEPFKYRGFYRLGQRTLFRYRINNIEMLDSPWVDGGKFQRTVAPIDQHPLRIQIAQLGPHLRQGTNAQKWPDAQQWPQTLQTTIKLGADAPYALDTIELPVDNPWGALFFASGHDFLPDGSALVCTMQGDVWKVNGFAYPSQTATWRRFASGLHHPQGIVVDDDGIFVLGRDQITRLHDFDQDGEADYYECFSDAMQTSAAGHDFICGLVRDAAGNFFTASGNQGVLRITADGQRADVVATGLRNPDGIGLTNDGQITVPASEGSWTPASMICAFQPPTAARRSAAPYFGFGGLQGGAPPALPLVYLPRGIDNSAGGQTTVSSDRWGPLQDQLLHFSFGAGAHFLVLRDQTPSPSGYAIQGAVVPLPGEFASGAHRGRFSPHDGQLYVSGMHGWGSYTPQTGSFERVRYTGEAVQLPIGLRITNNGIWLKFSHPLDRSVAAKELNHFAQCWNYRYSQAYGSPEYSTKHFGMPGHDTVAIRSAHVDDDGKGLFLEIPELQPVNQLHLRVQVASETFRELFVTVHALPREPFPLDSEIASPPKQLHPHPIYRDLAMVIRGVENPFSEPIEGARVVTITTATNLSYATRSFRAIAGEPIALTLSNPDVVPHNWALVKPGTLERVGGLANQLISDPEAAVRHYIPQSADVLAHTDVVGPKAEFTIYFLAPENPGRYPYLCTFPGHWRIMNGEMIVTAAKTPANR